MAKKKHNKSNYRKWLEQLTEARANDGWAIEDFINDPTYDYELFYNKQPYEAKAMLNKDSNAHFTDIAKTSLHPTFSDESFYSGKKSIKNPKGIVGGHWSDSSIAPNASRYTLSDSQLQNGWDILKTIKYLSEAEDNGAEIRLPNGRLPNINGVRFDGVLPNIIVTPKTKKK